MHQNPGFPVGEWVALTFGLMFLYFACIVVGQVLLGLATYNDAKARRNDSPAMWGLLVGFLGLIPGIIYLCLRNEGSRRMIPCVKCGWYIQMNMPGCPRCGAPNPYAAPMDSPELIALKSKAKKQLIAAIIVLVSGILLMFIGVFGMMSGIFWSASVTHGY